MTPEVQALLSKARASPEAAHVLAQKGWHDFAASRAYYSMFYAAEALLLVKGLSFSSHSAVIAAFGKEFAKSGVLDAKFHRYLISGQDLRNAGDYDVGTPVTAEQADNVITWAAEFIGAVEGLLRKP
ncbi:MAG: HEPN domain-containing protein [Verrucomicrobiae bacterium]|nr:HEPN domain-containing protein [Verrucomicrobiae bacterium]MDW8309027.1 HEPN domain-containing protein [Verrucomicrobiales bacterium]